MAAAAAWPLRATAPRFSPASATAGRPARQSRSSSVIATGSTGSRRCTSSRRCRTGRAATKRAGVTRPRPGHADLAGALKYGHEDIRDVLERASARETAARVAAGSLARQLLGRFGVRIASHVSAIGNVVAARSRVVSFEEASALPDDAPLRCVDADLQQRMIAFIDAAKEAGDTVGGAFEVIATGVPPGLGSYVQWDRKLDGRLGQAHAVHPRDQGRRHRHRPGGRGAARLARARRDPAAGRRPTRRCGPPTTPAASKAASPTARTCA